MKKLLLLGMLLLSFVLVSATTTVIPNKGGSLDFINGQTSVIPNKGGSLDFLSTSAVLDPCVYVSGAFYLNGCNITTNVNLNNNDLYCNSSVNIISGNITGVKNYYNYNSCLRIIRGGYVGK